MFEKIGLTVKLLKIFDIYFCDLATDEKIAIIHLLYAMELQTMCNVFRKIVLELKWIYSTVRISK